MTIYGRVVAVFHGAVRDGEADLRALMAEGEEALLNGDVETALVRFQTLVNILPDNKMVADQLAMALNPTELIRDGVLLEGVIRYPGDPPEEIELPPFLRATALDESGQDEIVYLESPEATRVRIFFRSPFSLFGQAFDLVYRVTSWP